MENKNLLMLVSIKHLVAITRKKRRMQRLIEYYFDNYTTQQIQILELPKIQDILRLIDYWNVHMSKELGR